MGGLRKGGAVRVVCVGGGGGGETLKQSERVKTRAVSVANLFFVVFRHIYHAKMCFRQEVARIITQTRYKQFTIVIGVSLSYSISYILSNT